MKNSMKLVVLTLTGLTLAGCGANGTTSTGGSKEEKVKIGLITLHDTNSTYDNNFIQAMKQACEEENAEMVLKTGVDEGDVCYTTAAELADDGCKAVFADSFGHEKYMIKAAKEFTSVEFAHATGTQAKQEKLANYHNAFADIYQGRYLAGVAAGVKLQDMIANNTLPSKAKQEDGKYILGYVGAFTYAEVVSGYTAWYLGVKSVVSNVTMKVQFTGSWYDEAAEKTAANALIDAGAAVVSQHADSMGAPSACETAGVPNVSYNGSTESACPNTFIVSSRINWVPYFKYMIQSVKQGKKFDTDWSGTIANGAVELTSFGAKAAPSTTAAKVTEAKNAINAGTLKVFDTSKFTVKGETLTSYLADIDGDYTGETNVIKNGYFDESNTTDYRSAPYFDIQIDGIELLNTKF